MKRILILDDEYDITITWTLTILANVKIAWWYRNFYFYLFYAKTSFSLLYSIKIGCKIESNLSHNCTQDTNLEAMMYASGQLANGINNYNKYALLLIPTYTI